MAPSDFANYLKPVLMNSWLSSDSGLEAEVRRLLDICVEKASKPIAPSLDKQKHDTEMHIKSNCMHHLTSDFFFAALL